MTYHAHHTCDRCGREFPGIKQGETLQVQLGTRDKPSKVDLCKSCSLDLRAFLASAP